MSQNLLDLVQNYFTSDTVRQTSAALGESESSVGTALRSVVPMALGGLLAHAQQPGGAANLLGMARQAHSSGLLGNLSGLLGGLGSTPATTPAADGGLLSRGGELLRSVMGNGYTPAVAAVGQQAGVGSSTVSSLMSLAVPVVLGLLGRHASQNNLDANGLGSYLSEQRGSITSALSSLPGGLSTTLSGLGLGTAATNTAGQAGSTVAAAANRTGDAVRDTAHNVETTVASPNRWPWIILALAVLAAALYFMRGCNQTPEATAPVATTMPAAPARAHGPLR